ncbi:DgyrCDS10432 [Dimorphilus gyrociliatus]|uniref:enoyl-CoA hydratase n=1 Tax=Dimorphilus gyrociliatus TaxID=2664684 RepID=A0A7I8W0A2_9ANNE|nr:DgyrCDS10432 [Dimorphilus gyrociliatus]
MYYSMLESCKTAEEIQHLSRICKGTFNEIAESKKPIVAAIMGQCLGAGLETALACHYRIAVRDKKTVLAVPEVMIGLLPGAGGTQRLLRLLSLPDAFDMMLTGKNIRPDKAKTIGLVHMLIDPKGASDSKESKEATRKHLEQVAIETAKGLVDGSIQALPRRKGWVETITEYIMWFNLGRYFFMTQARNRVMNMTQGHYPAPLRILDVVEETLKSGYERGNQLETRYFGELGVTKESKALIGLFHGQTHCKKNHYGSPSPIKKVGILGTNSIGAGIAEITIFKGYPLSLYDKSKENLEQGLIYIKNNLKQRVLRKQISDNEKDKLVSKLETGTELESISNVDFVIEASTENFDKKCKLLLEIESIVKPSCVIAVQTLFNPIEKVAKSAKRLDKIIGMHYFSPLAKSQLLEIVSSKSATKETIATAVDLGLKQGKIVIVVGDGPCFYTTRILCILVDELVSILREGIKPKQLEDMTKKIGWPMGLCSVVDEFGIDNIYEASKVLCSHYDENLLSKNLIILEQLVKKGMLGKKIGLGLFEYDPTRKLSIDNPAAIKIIDDNKISPKESLTTQNIQWRLVSRIINEAVLCLEEGTLKSPLDGDIGAVFGLGFPPFLGGPFRYLDIHGAEQLVKRMENFRKVYGDAFKPCKLLIEHSKDSKKLFRS